MNQRQDEIAYLLSWAFSTSEGSSNTGLLQTQYHVGDICGRNVDIAFSLSSALTLHLPVCHVLPNSTRLGRTGGSSQSMILSSLYLASPHSFVLLGQ